MIHTEDNLAEQVICPLLTCAQPVGSPCLTANDMIASHAHKVRVKLALDQRSRFAGGFPVDGCEHCAKLVKSVEDGFHFYGSISQHMLGHEAESITAETTDEQILDLAERSPSNTSHAVFYLRRRRDRLREQQQQPLVLHDVDCPMTNGRVEDRTSCICDLPTLAHGSPPIRDRREGEFGVTEAEVEQTMTLLEQPTTTVTPLEEILSTMRADLEEALSDYLSPTPDDMARSLAASLFPEATANESTGRLEGDLLHLDLRVRLPIPNFITITLKENKK